MNDPFPVGSRVQYHGSHKDMHGVYVITAHQDNRLGVPVSEIPEYTDGVCYDLWPEGVSQTYANREYALYFVRRDSLTLIGGAS